MRALCFALVALFAGSSVPALADAGNFTLINGAGAPITSVAIRRVGSNDWRPLSYAASPGGRAVVPFSDSECAFDIRASLGGTEVTWGGVNLCEVKSVTLSRNASGVVWVDYD